MTSQFVDIQRCFASLVKFSYWSKFHLNIITGSGVMTIYFYKGLTRNPEIGNTPVGKTKKFRVKKQSLLYLSNNDK